MARLKGRDAQIFTMEGFVYRSLYDCLSVLYKRVPQSILKTLGIRGVIRSKVNRTEGETQVFEGCCSVSSDGTRHSGPCAIYYADGDAFIGTVNADGLFDGEGTFLWSSGMKYVGHFKNQFKNGHGKVIFADGSWFECDNFSSSMAAQTAEDEEDGLLPDPEGSKGIGILHHPQYGDVTAALETCGYEWKGSLFFTSPIFRIEALDVGHVYAVSARDGVLNDRPLVFRQGMWEYQDE